MGVAYQEEIEIARPGDLGATPWKLTKMRPITVLFGKNGSGKSRLLRQWRNQDTAHLHYTVPERTGELNYSAGLLHEQADSASRSGTSQRNFASNYREQVISRIPGYFAKRGGAKVPRGDPEELQTLINRLLPDFAIELRAAKNPPFGLTRTADGNDVGSIDNLSSGEAQILTLGLDVLTAAAIWDLDDTPIRIMLIDEPDAHIHPDLQVRFADFLTAVADRFKLQVVIATHSTTFLAAIGQFAGENAGVTYLDRVHNDFEVQPFTKYKKELAAFLGGHALMGPLFGVPILLVEGDDDYRVWSQVPRHHHISLAVIPSHGDEILHYQESLEQLFESLREDKEKPAGYALLDGDKKLPDPAKVPQLHIRFIQLQCHELENLYLTDEVLALMGTDWVKAAVVIAAQEQVPAKAKLADAAKWDRQKVDLKGLMEVIAKALDPKGLHWSIRVAKAIGVDRPEGQLSAFLGDGVIAALWGEKEGHGL